MVPPSGVRKRAQVFRRTFVGCWTCRRRKVKCDATRPSCARCERAKVECEGYDIKLNWSVPLSNIDGEFCSLTGKKVNGGDPTVEMEAQMQGGSSTTIQRSNIDLVKWWLYDFYEDMDDDLTQLERSTRVAAGPFGVIRYSTPADKKKIKQTIRKQLPAVRPNIHRTSSSDTSSTSRQSPPQKGPLMLKTASLPSLPPHPNPPVPMARSSTSKPQKTPPPLSILQPFRDITRELLNYNDTTTITKGAVVLEGQLLQQFVDSIPDFFDSSIKGRLSAKVREVTGNYVMNDRPLDLCVILSIMALVILKSAKSSDHQLIFKAIAYKTQVDLIFTQQTTDYIHSYDSLALLLVLIIMVDTVLGIHEPRLFQFTLDEYHSTSPLMQDYYHFFQATNVLLNHDQFQFDAKFLRIYADMLDPHYNLLKPEKKSKEAKPSMYGEIEITSCETPADKIMRVPRYIDEEIEDDTEAIPPTFTIHFRGNEGTEGSGNKSPTTSEKAFHDEVDEGDSDDSEIDDIEDNISLVNVFRLNIATKDTVSVYGISKNLMTLYMELCQLVNHRRHFVYANMNSRNFAKVCADFEDILIRQAPSFCRNERDEKWYHLLVVIYFKLVRNYPRSSLTYHLKKIQGEDTIGLFQLFSTMAGDQWPASAEVWCNNWRLKEWLWNNSEDSFKDWAYDEGAPGGMFLF